MTSHDLEEEVRDILIKLQKVREEEINLLKLNLKQRVMLELKMAVFHLSTVVACTSYKLEMSADETKEFIDEITKDIEEQAFSKIEFIKEKNAHFKYENLATLMA